MHEIVADEIVHELVVDALVHNDSVDTFEEVVIVVDLTGARSRVGISSARDAIARKFIVSFQNAFFFSRTPSSRVRWFSGGKLVSKRVGRPPEK